MFEIVQQILVGLVIGTAIGVSGIGGGALIQPALIHLLNIAPLSAVGIGLVYSMFTKIFGAVAHHRLGNIQYEKSLFFLIGSVPGVVCASFLLFYIEELFGADRVNQGLQIFIGVVLVLTAGSLIHQQYFMGSQRDSYEHRLSKKMKFITISCGFIIGALMGLTSVGGGVLIIPFFIAVLGCTARFSIGSSILISLGVSAMGGLVYLISGKVPLDIVAYLCAGSFPGVFIGSKLTSLIPDKTLKNVIIVIVTGCGLSLLIL